MMSTQDTKHVVIKPYHLKFEPCSCGQKHPGESWLSAAIAESNAKRKVRECMRQRGVSK